MLHSILTNQAILILDFQKSGLLTLPCMSAQPAATVPLITGMQAIDVTGQYDRCFVGNADSLVRAKVTSCESDVMQI